jgi:hypothetical protein
VRVQIDQQIRISVNARMAQYSERRF